MRELDKRNDKFVEHTISKAEMYTQDGTQHCYLHLDDSTSIGTGPISYIPQEGDKVRLYGKGFGYTVRGIDIQPAGKDWIEIYYRTEDEEERHQQWVATEKLRKQAEFIKNKADLDERVAKLPQEFQDRIQRFRDKNPEFRVEFESYELFCCEEAVKIYNALKDPDKIMAFFNMPIEDQKAAVPDVKYSEHSGNPFGCAVTLAGRYATRPQFLKFAQGSLAPLVGSEEFGSTIDEDEKKEIEAMGGEVVS